MKQELTQGPLSENWNKIIDFCLARGGKLVFVNGTSPRDKDFETTVSDSLPWIAAAQNSTAPILKLDGPHFLQRKVRTQNHDLIFFWNPQTFSNNSLNSWYQGQRVFLGSSGFDSTLMDYHWPDIGISNWQNYFSGLDLAHLPAATLLPEAQPKPCLFLDRDDVIVKNIPYNCDPSKVELLPGIAELIHAAHENSFWVAMVSNQSGLARKLIGWDQYQKVHQKMLELLAKKDCWLDDCIWAGALPMVSPIESSWELSLRKPRVGMFQRVYEKLGVDFSTSIMVGDSASDLIAAYGMNIEKLCLLKSDKADEQMQLLADFKIENQKMKYEAFDSLASVTKKYF